MMQKQYPELRVRIILTSHWFLEYNINFEKKAKTGATFFGFITSVS